ncbi:hypothetical protein PMN64_37605 [Bradyrhizobium sp. UFLA01-814]|uniref:hypothetical protein n=1 Tax=Bradyrhizobium sp. UFLA01-814 TaxID=3023480 RepID=UPI00398AE702
MTNNGGVGHHAASMRLREPIFKAGNLTVKNLSVAELAAGHHDEMLAYVAPLAAARKVKYREDISQGLEAIPGAFLEMMRGDNLGKMLVQVNPDQMLGQS